MSHLFLICLICFSVELSFFSFALAAITPERDVVVNETHEEPQWKTLWDHARELTRDERYAEAALEYSHLLKVKKNIEEALWEYAGVLIQLKEWDQAGTVLDGLMETDPGRLDYLVSAGGVALHRKEYASASSYYELLYQRRDELSAASRLEVLKNFVAALHAQHNDKVAFPLMEELARLTGGDELLWQLAVTAQRLGYREKAAHYYTKLVSREQVEGKILLEAAIFFEGAGQEGAALLCWEKYLLEHPDYLPFQKKMVDHFLRSGQKEAALPHLLVLLDQEPQEEERLLQIGSIYLVEMRRPDKALAYYEKYAARHPENQDVRVKVEQIQATLARELVFRVDQDGALPLWKELVKVTPNRRAIYESMAELLEKRGNHQQLHDVLVILHQQEPGDKEVLFRLIDLCLDEKDLQQAARFLALVPEREPAEARYLLANGRLADLQGDFPEALVWYGRYLEQMPQDRTVRDRVKDIAAGLGLIEQYQNQLQWLRSAVQSEDERSRLDLEYAKVLLASGMPGRARIIAEKLLDGGEKQADLRFNAALVRAEACSAEGLFFEAEQVLRQMLVQGGDAQTILARLVDNALQGQDLAQAESWFSLLGAYSPADICEKNMDSRILLEARILSAQGKFGKAVGKVLDYKKNLQNHCSCERNRERHISLTLAHLYLQDHQYEQGRDVLTPLIRGPQPDLAALILDQQFLQELFPAKTHENRVAIVLRDNLHQGAMALLEAARDAFEYSQYSAAREYVEQALQVVPDSLSAQVLHVKILRHQGDLEAATVFLQDLIHQHSEERSFSFSLLELQFQQGAFHQIIEGLVPSRSLGIVVGLAGFPDTGHLSMAERLLLARSLWADHQWVSAVAVYDSLLQPPVDQIFMHRLEQEHVVLALPPQQKTLWNILTFTHASEPDRLTTVMSPDFVVRGSGQPGNLIGVELYAGYRWQQLVATELSARRALAQGNYYQAMKEYQDVVEKNASPESLFDLAGIYSRLGLLGKEALLYEQMERENPEYPGLAESVERNSLKRKTRINLDSEYSSLSGRNGYYDIKQVGGGSTVWMLPTLKQEMEVRWKTLHAMSMDTDQDLWRNRLLATYSFFPFTHLDVITQLGLEKPAGDREASSYPATPLYQVEFRSRLGDDLHGFIRFKQDMVDDTVEALERGITKCDLEGGAQIDLLPRLFGGGEYLFREYSDANHQNRYNVWGTYVLHTEPLLLELTYSQELSHNAEGNNGRDFSFENGFAPGDHPYWSPKEYWQNQIMVHFKHQLSADVLGRSSPSYYTLHYAIGYEDGGYDSHSFGGDVFLEMSRHFLVSSSFEIIEGGPVVRKDLALSLVYRW